MSLSWPKKLPADFFIRFLVAFLVLVVVFPALFIGYYFIFWGRIFFFIFLGCLLFYSLFEIFNHFQSKKIYTFLLAFLGIFLFVLPVRKDLIETTFSKDANFDWNLTFFLIKWQFLDYHIFFIFPLTLIVSFFDNKIEKTGGFFLAGILKFSIIFISTLFFKSLWILNTFNFFLVIFLISIPITSDTFGYLFGSIFAKKFFRTNFNFSPKKSVEGFISSFIFSLILVISIILNFDFNISTSRDLLLKILAILLLPSAAIIGDIFFSIIKRYLKIKDFSKIIKGHGGIFDRLDSISFVFLVFSFIVITVS